MGTLPLTLDVSLGTASKVLMKRCRQVTQQPHPLVVEITMMITPQVRIILMDFTIRPGPTVCATPITVMGSVVGSIMGLFSLRNAVYLVNAIK